MIEEIVSVGFISEFEQEAVGHIFLQSVNISITEIRRDLELIEFTYIIPSGLLLAPPLLAKI